MQGLPGRPTAQALAVPLSIHDRQAGHSHLLGVLQVERLNRPPFTLQEVELVEGLAAQAALALHANLSLASERWRLRLLTLVRQVSLQVLDLRDLDEIARRITQLIRQTFDYYYVAIFTLTAGQDTLHLRASAGPQETQAEGEAHSPVLTVEPGQGLIGYVAQAGQEIVANDVHAEPRFRYLDSLPETRSEVVLPLAAQDRLLGVLDVQSDQPGDFDDTDMLVLRALAGNIAIAIHSAQLYKALHQRASQLAAVYEVSSALTSILDQEKLLDEVVDLIHKRFGYPYVHLYTVHPGRRKVFYEAGSGARSQEPGLGEIAYDLDDPLGLIPWVARHGETALANDVSQDARYRALYSPDDTRAELTVPLIFGNQVLGILDVQSNRAEAFGEEDRFLFEALAGHIAIAMRNAHLYQSEIWRRQVADSLREGAGLLSADIDLDQALEAILAELERTLPLDVAAIWLLDEYGGLDAAEEGPPALHLAAVRGPCVAELDIETGLSPEDLLLYNGFASPAQAPEPPISAWLHQALSAEQPVIRADHSPFDPLGVMLQFPADYSAIAAPLRVGDQPRGLLVLAHRTAGRYGSEARAMTAAFASYAAVAIENARLYEEAHEQAWVSTVLLQVAEATQSLTDLNELLATVIRITPMLAGVKACLLYILDDDGDFIPAAATGLPPGQQQEFERWRFAPGDVPALDRLVLDRQPLILHNRADDQRLAGILRPAQPVSPSHETNLAVLVPVLARGEVLGAFLVDYSLSIASHSGKPLDAFFDERLAILQGIAHQTAIAVDNIRLLKAQKEEAYVSVALLQVAQAVVSSSDLDETLGSIVRITPILVGVKRALVYLWNENQRAFHLSQAYGVARAAEARQFAPGEFPLLDAVLIEGELLACPLWDEIAASDQVPEVWAGLAAPEPQIVSQYLENAACLLIALPLSVKGKVLGVFLVEEPEPTPREGFSSVNANRRLREKRLEIITGISQQAALAIQNEQLQRETVERERLEREMQLAREIQRAFVPQSLPKLPGWELEVCWCLAREVGGDFYDVFDLPGNRLALVIADVADKGMPAALFMTLARTLLRATVQEIDSPAESLERVNNIIVPEATSGMFVTIFYAVLDLDTGELEYANAGHNLPVILRARTQQIELLERCGMALGVLENNRIHNRKILLETGDCLVMYTDGITEAFSLEYEPFGEARLLQIILDFAHPEAAGDQAPGTAQNLLDTINRAVQNFVGEASLSDDQTILVLKRD
jgi:GAF domain-containing protein